MSSHSMLHSLRSQAHGRGPRHSDNNLFGYRMRACAMRRYMIFNIPYLVSLTHLSST